MSATKQDISRWLKEAQQKEATHLIVALDKFDYDNYPVYVSSEEKIEEQIQRIESQSMQGIDEVYNMSMDIDKQLSEGRVWNV
jgi:gamma-glutamylcyclotransferase (GGCT)/AIG2-like uncharacterized protein YtfP